MRRDLFKCLICGNFKLSELKRPKCNHNQEEEGVPFDASQMESALPEITKEWLDETWLCATWSQTGKLSDSEISQILYLADIGLQALEDSGALSYAVKPTTKPEV